jgi:X-Pro dipeptidyl-peptidase (S15 family)
MKFFSTGISAVRFLVIILLALTQARISCAQQGILASDPLVTNENLNSLTLEGSDLKPEKPIVGEKDELPEFTRELIQLHWRFADPIDIYVIRPKGAEKPPVVLYLYSYPSEGDQFKDDSYCRRVTQGGFAAVGFVSALTGQRYHGRPMKKWFVSELQEALVTSTHDVQMILNYLATRDDLNMDRVGMMGAGSGATIAILAATVEPRIKALDLLNPWADWPDWMAYSARVPDAERPNYTKPEFLKQVAPFDPIRWLSHLKTLPVRLEILKDDVSNPASCQKRIEKAAPKGFQIVEYENTRALLDASAHGKHFQWIKDQLLPSTERAEVN